MKKETESPRLRAGLIALGCAKNLVDAEIMLGSLLKGGVEITNDAANADVLIVNTCSFIDSAQEESVDAILESAELRDKRRPQQALIVAGCLPQRFRKDLPALMPEVDAFMGGDQVTSVRSIIDEAIARRAEKLKNQGHQKPGKAERSARVRQALAEIDAKSGKKAGEEGGKKHSPASNPLLLKAPVVKVNTRPSFIPEFLTPRFRLTPRHFAYVKIAEGCNHPCSFCVIPQTRGSHRSRPQADIVAEAKALLSEGVRELNLISQDTTYYGLDLRPNASRAIAGPERFKSAVAQMPAGTANLASLLRELNALPGDFWIRLLYTHPAHWTDELIATIRDCPKVVRYVDIPLQHIDDTMLEGMRRETSGQYIVDLLGRIRAAIPGIALRTTFITGFPGETEAAYKRLVEFIEQTRFERLGVFAYSQEEGTRAAKMDGQIPEEERQRRRKRAMKVQHTVAVAVAESFVGRTLKVLVEGEATQAQLTTARIQSWEHGLLRGKTARPLNGGGKFLVARGEADAPDIDGRVYIRGKLPPGEFAMVRVIGHTDYDLIAEPVA